MSKKDAPNREIELKFEVSSEQMRRLRRSPFLRKFASDQSERAELRSIYFDTPDFALRDQNMSLRVRHKDGVWTQTAKIGRDIVAGFTCPIEIEHRVDGPAIDIHKLKDVGFSDKVAALLDASALAPVFETNISRETHQLRYPGGSLIEIAFDTGKVTAGNSATKVLELELELISGKPSSLFCVAERLTRGETVRFSDWSKAERGYRLCAGEASTPLRSKTLSLPDLSPGAAAADAFGQLLFAFTNQIAHNWKIVLDSDEVEGPHQLRIGLRQLRSLLQAFRPIAGKKKLRRLDRSASKLAAITGRLRDADVLLNTIVSDGEFSQDRGFSALRQKLVQEREDIRKKVRAKLAGGKMMRLLLKLGALAQSPDKLISGDKAGNRPVEDIAAAALTKSWNSANRWGRNIEHLSIEERHRMRKCLKTHRYQVDAFASLYPRRLVKPYRKKLKTLQDIFGYLNDVAMAEQLTGSISKDEPKADKIQRACGMVLEWHTARSELTWRQARHKWKGLTRARQFWIGETTS